jgi:hypothetical protein
VVFLRIYLFDTTRLDGIVTALPSMETKQMQNFSVARFVATAALILLPTVVSHGAMEPAPHDATVAEISGSANGEEQRAAAKEIDQQTALAPRMPDGKPDFSGTWAGGGGYLNNDLPGKVLPYTPAGEQAYRFNMTTAPDPQSLCILVGVPRADLDGYPFEIVQSPKRVAFLYERDSAWRVVPLDGRDHPKDPDPAFFGNTTARWDGDALVVDVIGIKGEKIWTDNEGHPQSDALHLVERWTRPDASHLQVVLTIDDPKYYTKTFTVSRKLKLQKFEPAEFACDENNIDREHLGPGLGTKDGTRGYDKTVVPAGKE